MEALDILTTGHLPITLISPTQLTYMLDQVEADLQKTNTDYTLLFLHLFYYYDMKLISYGYDKDCNLLLQFPVFIKPCIQKLPALYQLETISVPIKDNNTGANS